MSIAGQIITSIKSGDITAIRVGEELKLLADLYPVLILPADPFPRIQITGFDVVVKSGTIDFARISCESCADAQVVGDAIEYWFRTLL